MLDMCKKIVGKVEGLMTWSKKMDVKHDENAINIKKL